MHSTKNQQPTPPEPPEGVTAHRDLAYVANGHERQKLDLYLPERSENRPLLIWWYADHPTHYQGDASLATAETGEQILDANAQFVARAVRAIKADTEAKRLQDEFFAGSAAP